MLCLTEVQPKTEKCSLQLISTLSFKGCIGSISELNLKQQVTWLSYAMNRRAHKVTVFQ